MSPGCRSCSPNSASSGCSCSRRRSQRSLALESSGIQPRRGSDQRMMDRRAFITVVGGSIFAAPLAVEAQQAGKRVPRIGYLTGGSLNSERVVALRQGLRELGYVEGQDIAFEWRSAEGKADRLPGLAAELVRLKVDVIV